MNVGKMLLKLREKMGVSQTQLGQGLAEVVEISRLEGGDNEPDILLVEALFQRLGKSVDKLELVISGVEYRRTLLRSLILEGLQEEEYEVAESLIKEYERFQDGDKPLHRQFLQWMRTLHGYFTHGDKAACAKGLENALEITFPQWREERLVRGRVCMQEIRILLFLLALRLEMGETEEAANRLNQVLVYLEKWCTDKEEKAKIYPQYTWVLGRACYIKGDWETAYAVCGRGVACLSENGVLSVMDKLLEVQIACLKKMGGGEEIPGMENIRRAIRYLYQVTGTRIPEGEMLYLLLAREQKELLVSKELLKELRLSQGLSQAQLSDGICSWETLSRIERGRSKPNRKNLYQMFQKMGLERERYYGYIQADDFELYERVREVHIKWICGENLSADELAEEIAQQLDMSIPVNRQFIETHRLVSEIMKGKMAWEDASKEAERILCYTMKDFHGTVYRTPFRQECVLLNQIALCLRHMGKLEEAIELWEQVLCRLRGGEVAEQHHASSLMLVYLNYAGSLEVNGCLDKSEEEGIKGIRLALKCQRGDDAAKILANLACVYAKSNTQEKDLRCERCLCNSFVLLKLYGYEQKCKMVKDYYEKKYNRCFYLT